MARSSYGKELLVRVTICFCTMSSLNKGDVHNCRLCYDRDCHKGVRAGCKDDKNRRRLV